MMKFNLKTIMRWMHWWPPFLGAGVRVRKFSPDVNDIEVEMKLHFGNKNYFHTHFGGSLYSMTDPFFAFILVHHLGKKYIVWDKVGTIRYKHPGRGKVYAKFHIPPAEIERIRHLADTEDKVEPQFQVNIVDETGRIIAEVDRILYVKRKDKIREKNRSS